MKLKNKTENSSDHWQHRVLRATKLTRLSLMIEAVWRFFWPVFALFMAGIGAITLGLLDVISVWAAFAFLLCFVCGISFLIWRGSRAMRLAEAWPSWGDALTRVDQALPGRPLCALTDAQAIGASDPASVALWQAHLKRMQDKAAQAQAYLPNFMIAAKDPYALRYVALLVLVLGGVFGSFARLGQIDPISGAQTAQATDLMWEGWIEPPQYTGLPTLYLNDQDSAVLHLIANSKITMRFYGDLSLYENVSAHEVVEQAELREYTFQAVQAGQLVISDKRDDVAEWDIQLQADNVPQVTIVGTPELEADGNTSIAFRAQDDFGVLQGQVRVELDLPSVPRDHGLAIEPDQRDGIVLDLPITIAGDRRDFEEVLTEDFSDHPWANLPVTFEFTVEDIAGQTSQMRRLSAPLVVRRFFDPVAAALVEQRRDLLWARANAPRVEQLLRVLTHLPQDLFPKAGTYLQLKLIQRRLAMYRVDGLTLDEQDEIAAALWALAVQLENGDIGDALERMQQAQERLTQAMRDGASEEEIARLMQDLRDATQDYLRQLTREAEAEDSERAEQSANTTELTQDDLQAMMDRIQDLMEQGRMAEAEQALQELQQMLENMRVTQGGGGQGGSPGQQALEELSETLREQQDLSDEAFRDLQDQYTEDGSGQGDPSEGRGESLAQRQQELRDALRSQEGTVPFDSPEGEASREALDRAGRAMDNAEEALREGDYAEAIDQQSDAMEAMREGMRALGEAMAQERGGQGGQSGENGQRGNGTDPLGRALGSQQGDTLDPNILNGEVARRRARELLEELRRRSGETNRPQLERDYLERLLKEF